MTLLGNMPAAVPREPPDSFPTAARLLERALLFTILAHAAAMLSMALLLLPGMPGGGNPLAARAAYIAASPWVWRLGWLPWQLTALSDLVLGLALLRTAWIPRIPALLVVLTTLAAILVEQPGEYIWITQGVALAQAAVQAGNPALYAQFETQTYLQIAGWAAALYVAAACGWTLCFARAKTWHPRLAWLSGVTWGVLLAVSIGPLLPDAYRPGAGMIAAGNALGFALMMVWFCVTSELVLRRARPDSAFGRLAVWIYPRQGLGSSLLNMLANSRLARAFGEWLPPIAFRSDVTNVIYANYLVEAGRLAPLVPWGLELQTLGSNGAYALFTHLTYQHGHFGPEEFGALRRFMPSPIQSNWRIYVRNPQTQRSGIYFVTTAIDQTLPALLARLLSEGIPMHVVRQAEVSVQSDGAFRVCLDPGAGSAPDLDMSLKPSPPSGFTGGWRTCFASFHDLLAYCVPQDRAMSSQPWYERITRQEIDLGIPLDSCEPLAGVVVSSAAQAIVGGAQPVCFRVPQVTLRFKREEHDSY